jgi:hypothetical protein
MDQHDIALQRADRAYFCIKLRRNKKFNNIGLMTINIFIIAYNQALLLKDGYNEEQMARLEHLTRCHDNLFI